MSGAIATSYVELALDDTPYKRGQEAIYGKVKETATGIENAYKAVGSATAAVFESMKSKAGEAFETIKKDSESAAKAVYEDIKGAFVSVWTDVKAETSAIYESIKSDTVNKMKEYADAAGKFLVGIGEKLAITGAAFWAFGAAGASWAATILAAIGAVVIAFKSLDFLIGLVTGKSYKSDAIDALIAQRDATESLRVSLRLSTADALAYSASMQRLGIDSADVVTVFTGVRSAVRTNWEELDRLGVKYEDANGYILDQKTILESAKKTLEEYTEGWDRDQAAVAIGMGSLDQINKTLKITGQELQRSKADLDKYHLGIGAGTTKAVDEYQAAMVSFKNESKLMADGISRAVADQILPAFTSLANFFSGGWPFIVDTFRYTMATVTTLLYGLKTSFDIVVDSVKGASNVLSDIFIALAKASARAMTGDFAGAKDAMIEGWASIQGRVTKTWKEMQDDAKKSSDAIKMAWGFDDREAGAKAAPKKGKKWVGAPDEETVGAVDNATKAILEAIRKATYEIDGIGQSQYMKDLERITSEAEKYRALGVERVLIDRYVYEERTLAQGKQTERDLKAFEKTYDDQIEYLDKLALDRVKYADEEKAREIARGKAAHELYRDMRGYEKEFYDASLALIDQQAQRYRDLRVDESAVVAWQANEYKKAEISKLKAAGTFSDGVKASLMEMEMTQMTWGKAGAEMADATARSMKTSFSDLFYDGLTGQLKSLEDYFKAFYNSIARAFSDTVSKMLVDWMMLEAQTGMKGAGGGLMNLLGMGGGTQAGAGVATAGMEGALAELPLFFHQGGIVGMSGSQQRPVNPMVFANAPRYHNGLMPNEVPAILERGEMVIPKNKVGKRASGGGGSPTININIMANDAKSFSDMCNRNPAAFIAPITKALQNNQIRNEWGALLNG